MSASKRLNSIVNQLQASSSSSPVDRASDLQSVPCSSSYPVQEYREVVKRYSSQPIYRILPTLSRSTLSNKTLFITGASRGIGLAIALAAAKDGANIIIAAKTVTEDPRLPGTIYTAAEEVRKAGGRALPIPCDIRFEDQVAKALEQGAKEFGGIDIVVNNASAISLTSTSETNMKKFDLMNQINYRGTFLTSKLALPYLKKSSNPHILNMSPPLNFLPEWFGPHTAYSIAKYNMSLCVLGLSAELKSDNIAVNALWPLTTIATAAVSNLLGGADTVKQSRTTQSMSDAAYFILTAPSSQVTGNFFIDDVLLRSMGKTEEDMEKYAVVKGTKNNELAPDFFV